MFSMCVLLLKVEGVVLVGKQISTTSRSSNDFSLKATTVVTIVTCLSRNVLTCVNDDRSQKPINHRRDGQHLTTLSTCLDGCFLKWSYPTTMGFPTKNDHFGVFGGSTILGNPQISDDRIFPLKRDPKGKAGFQSSRRIFKQTSEVGKNGTYSCFFLSQRCFFGK